MGAQPDPKESLNEDARWIAQILTTDSASLQEECYERLLKKYWRLVSVLAASKLGDQREAEDIAQEAFVRAFRSLHKLTKPIAFLGWLVKIARNLITDHIRTRRPTFSLDMLRDPGGPGMSVATSTKTPSFEKDLETSEEMEVVLKAMSRLPEKYREVVVLRYVQGLDGKTMARLLGEPDGTIRNRLFRALERLRADIDESRVRKS